MPNETKKSAPVPIIPDQSQPLNKNIGNLVKWNDGFGAAKPSPVPTSRPRIQSVSSCGRPSVAPQPIHLATHLSKTDEDDSDPTSSEEEAIRFTQATTRKFSSSSPPKPMLSSTPVNSNLTNTRPKQAESVAFALSKETPKENENNLSQQRTKPIEKPTSQGPKVISKQPSPANVQFPEHPRQPPAATKPVPPTEPKKAPETKPLMKGPPPIESRRITPPDFNVAPQRKQEIPKPISAPAPALPSQMGRRPLAPASDQGFVTHNGFISLDAFLVQLQDEAFDNLKLSMMEASIRQFHLIAADADISLTRQLCSIKTPNVAEKRQALIQAHKQSMEAQASSLLTDMSALHGQLKEQHTMAARGLFDIPVNEDSWERPLPPSSVPWNTPSPPIQSRSSDPWKPASSPPKTVVVPKPQAPAPDPTPEPELTMPSFWKPSWDSNLTEPPTPQVPPISRLATVEDVPDECDPEPATPAPVPKNAKPAQVPVQQSAPAKNQVPTVASEPTPVWGQPWRKGKQSVSNNSSNQATKPAQPSPPLPPVIENPPISPLVTVPTPEPTPASATETSPAQTKPKTAKQLRAEKNRKGKNKAAASVVKEEVGEQEEVPMPPPQEFQPEVSLKTGLDAAIANMVNTGNFQSTLEQFNLGWR